MPFAPVDQPDEIRRLDPWLSGTGKPSAWRERVMSFWAGPLRRYIPGCEAVDIRMELTTSACPISIPGSYAVEAHAHVRVTGAPERIFSVFRIKRHDPSCLARALRDIGWDPLDGWPYGHDVGYPRALSLFTRRGPAPAAERPRPPSPYAAGAMFPRPGAPPEHLPA